MTTSLPSRRIPSFTPLERQLRQQQKHDLVLSLLSITTIADSAMLAEHLGCGLRNAQKTAKNMAERGLIQQHQVPFHGLIYSLSRQVSEDLGVPPFDPRRTPSRIAHLLACGWLWIWAAKHFHDWMNDRECHQHWKQQPGEKRWPKIPDALGLSQNSDGHVISSTAFEVELSRKRNDDRARFYHALLARKLQILDGVGLESVWFFCLNEKLATALSTAIGQVHVEEGGREIQLQHSIHWPRFKFMTIADLKPVVA